MLRYVGSHTNRISYKITRNLISSHLILFYQIVLYELRSDTVSSFHQFLLLKRILKLCLYCHLILRSLHLHFSVCLSLCLCVCLPHFLFLCLSVTLSVCIPFSNSLTHSVSISLPLPLSDSLSLSLIPSLSLFFSLSLTHCLSRSLPNRIWIVLGVVLVIVTVEDTDTEEWIRMFYFKCLCSNKCTVEGSDNSKEMRI